LILVLYKPVRISAKNSKIDIYKRLGVCANRLYRVLCAHD